MLGLALLAFALTSTTAQAAPGDLDRSFSGDGRQTTDFGGGSDVASDVVLQPDGKLVAVGNHSYRGGEDFALARYNPDGSLDPSFSGDGLQTTDFGGGFQELSAAVLQADGKLVAVGSSRTPGTSDFALARYNPDGSLDPSFSSDGLETTDFGRGFDEASAVALRPDGKLVVVGNHSARGGGGFALARYNPDGSLDPSFSGDGLEVIGGGFEVSAAVLQPDGKLVAVGDAPEEPCPHEEGLGCLGADFALARFNPDGSLDRSFSGDGRQTTDFGRRFDEASDVALQPDGKLVAVGRSVSSGGESQQQLYFALARFNPDGSLDRSFSGDGRQTTDFGRRSDEASAVALQSDGKLVAVGLSRRLSPGDFVITSRRPDPEDFALARYHPDGSLDRSFSGDGRQTTSFGGGSDLASAVALQPDGKLVAVGFSRGANDDFVLARYQLGDRPGGDRPEPHQRARPRFTG